MTHDDRERVRERLAAPAPLELPTLIEPAGDFRPAAVLVPLYERDGRTHVLFTKRSETVGTHKGQIAFPGGRPEPGDADLWATALREAWEEAGIVPDAAELLGRLDDTPTISRYVIRPYVAFVRGPVTPRLQPDETVEAIEAPLAVLLDAEHYSARYTGIEAWPVDHRFRVGDHVVWGATARMTAQLLERVFDADFIARAD